MNQQQIEVSKNVLVQCSDSVPERRWPLWLMTQSGSLRNPSMKQARNSEQKRCSWL